MASYKDSDNYRLSHDWPALIKWPIQKTSDATNVYNCYAYVAGDTRKPWSPESILPRGVYWPVKVKPEEEDTIWPVVFAYATLKYDLCENGSFEADLEKIAIYVDSDDRPTHVAIQREGGVWQSKLGSEIDVVHSLESLESSDEFGVSLYGKAKYFMARKSSKSPVASSY